MAAHDWRLSTRTRSTTNLSRVLRRLEVELFAGVLGASLLVACGSSSDGGSNASTDGAGGSSAAGSSAAGGSSATGGTSAAGGSTSAGGGSAAGGSSSGGSTAAGGSGTGGTGSTAFPTQFGTYIELGDSISDMTQVPNNQPPFFYNLLFQNDDTAYPAWAGMDLKTKFGVQQHIHGAVAGSTGQDMKAQVAKLSATLPKPILVTVTIGGNDITAPRSTSCR
jgi:lysophospholipase L1-like esterase